MISLAPSGRIRRGRWAALYAVGETKVGARTGMITVCTCCTTCVPGKPHYCHMIARSDGWPLLISSNFAIATLFRGICPALQLYPYLHETAFVSGCCRLNIQAFEPSVAFDIFDHQFAVEKYAKKMPPSEVVLLSLPKIGVHPSASEVPVVCTFWLPQFFFFYSVFFSVPFPVFARRVLSRFGDRVPWVTFRHVVFSELEVRCVYPP